MNRYVLLPLIALGLSLAPVAASAADEHASKSDAQSMVQKAVAFLKANGPEKAYAEIDNKSGQFVDRDLYIVVYGLDGKCLAHGAKPELIGKDLSSNEDADGKPFIRERMELAKTKKSFWQDYKFANPTTKKVSDKTTYCETADDKIVCGGIYK